MISIIRHEDLNRWKRTGAWTFVYGRRKTGKSFFVKNFTKWDKYYYIGRAGEIFESQSKIDYDTFAREVINKLKEGDSIVIDEIQRLPEEFYDRLHNLGVQGNLTAISSTLWAAKRLIGMKSSLLGLFSEFKMNMIDERDILRNLSKRIKNCKELIEIATYLREPWLIPLWEKVGKKVLFSMATNSKMSVPALIGEIFSEEEKQLSSVYEAILKAVSDGKRISGEITKYVYALKRIPAQNPSFVHPYLNSLNKLGVLEKTKIFGKNKYVYTHTSPVMDLYYYMNEKYGFSERDLPENQIKDILKKKVPYHVEQFFKNLLSKIFGLGKEIISEKDYEIDIALTKFKKLKVVCEVKWKKRIDKYEIKRIEEVLNRFKCKKIMIVPEKKNLERAPKGIKLLDVKDILKIL